MSPASALDQAGNLYIVDFDGEIFRVEAPVAAQSRSAVETTSVARSAARIRIRCWTSCTSMSRWKVWKLPSRAVWSMLTMLAPWLPRMPATTASEPGWFLITIAQPRGAAVGLVAPGEIDPVGVDAVGEALAADHVDLDPLALAPQADDPVAGDRVAAFGELEGDARASGP